jgi:hypothetical protein
MAEGGRGGGRKIKAPAPNIVFNMPSYEALTMGKVSFSNRRSALKANVPLHLKMLPIRLRLQGIEIL